MWTNPWAFEPRQKMLYSSTSSLAFAHLASKQKSYGARGTSVTTDPQLCWPTLHFSQHEHLPPRNTHLSWTKVIRQAVTKLTPHLMRADQPVMCSMFTHKNRKVINIIQPRGACSCINKTWIVQTVEHKCNHQDMAYGILFFDSCCAHTFLNTFFRNTPRVTTSGPWYGSTKCASHWIISSALCHLTLASLRCFDSTIQQLLVFRTSTFPSRTSVLRGEYVEALKNTSTLSASKSALWYDKHVVAEYVTPQDHEEIRHEVWNILPAHKKRSPIKSNGWAVVACFLLTSILCQVNTNTYCNSGGHHTRDMLILWLCLAGTAAHRFSPQGLPGQAPSIHTNHFQTFRCHLCDLIKLLPTTGTNTISHPTPSPGTWKKLELHKWYKCAILALSQCFSRITENKHGCILSQADMARLSPRYSLACDAGSFCTQNAVHTNTYWNYITFLLGVVKTVGSSTLAEIRWLNVTTEVRMIVVEIGAWLLFEGKESEDLVERELFRIESSFFNCRALERVAMSWGVEQMGEFAFHFCDALAHIHIPASVTIIGKLVFAGWSSLSEISIPGSVQTFGDYAFGDCDSLERLPCWWGRASHQDHGAFRRSVVLWRTSG